MERCKRETTRFKIKNDIVVKKEKDGHKIYVPKNVVDTLITECHQAYGHIGAGKTHKIIAEHFYDPRLAKVARQVLRDCDSCQRNKVPTCASPVIQEYVRPEKPPQLLSIDFFGPLTKTKYGYEHILVMMDTFTKYTKLYPLRRATTKAAIRSLENFMTVVGKPERVLADRGTQFTSKKWTEALKEKNIKLVLTSVRHPQANMVERANRELARFFRTLLPIDEHKSWYNHVKK